MNEESPPRPKIPVTNAGEMIALTVPTTPRIDQTIPKEEEEVNFADSIDERMGPKERIPGSGPTGSPPGPFDFQIRCPHCRRKTQLCQLEARPNDREATVLFCPYCRRDVFQTPPSQELIAVVPRLLKSIPGCKCSPLKDKVGTRLVIPANLIPTIALRAVQEQWICG